VARITHYKWIRFLFALAVKVSGLSNDICKIMKQSYTSHMLGMVLY